MRNVSTPIRQSLIRHPQTIWFRLIPVAIAALLWQNAHAGIYLTEGFNYAAGKLTAWTNPNTNITVTTPGMVFGTLADTTPAGSGRLQINSVGSTGHSQSTNFTASPYVTSGTVYCSFLLNCTTAPTGNQYLIGLVAAGGGLTGSADPLLLYVNTSSTAGNYKLTIRHTGLGAISATNDMSPNVTNFIVLKYTFGNGGTAQLFINPSPGSTEPNNADATCGPGGTDPANLGSLGIKVQSTSAQGNWELDTIRVGSTWADVTPAVGACIPASVNTPVSQSVYAGLTTSFSVAAGGSSPTYQWQISTNSGSSWSDILNATNTSYLTPAVGLTNSGSPANGTQYRCTVNVDCGGGSSTNSPAATLTVLPAPNFTGVIVSNTWQSGLFSNPPPPQYSDSGVPETAGDIESCWFALGSTTTPGLSSTIGSMTANVQTNSRTWLTYVTSNGVVHLNPGEAITATTVFTPQGIVNNTNANLVFGLFNSLAPGASRLMGNSSSGSSGGANVQGYAFAVNFSSTFHTNIFTNNPNFTPIEFRVRTNLPSTDFMGTSSDYTSIGAGGATNGAPGFVDNATYTNVFSVTCNANGTVTLTSQFTGPAGFNLTYTTNDILNTNNVDFDTFAIRPSNNATTATNLIFSLFEFQKGVAAGTPIPLGWQVNGTNLVLSWTDPTFTLYSGTNITQITNPVAVAATSYTNPMTGNANFFRLKHP